MHIIRWLLKEASASQEVIELTEADQRLLWEEVGRASRAIKKLFDPACKLNIATLGNVVSSEAFQWIQPPPCLKTCDIQTAQAHLGP